MKKLTIEEKAKRYDEALGKARRYYDEYKTRDNILYVEDMEDMFPELKESEDERIRKWIIGVLSTYEHDRDLRNAAIVWLGKQGEQKPANKIALQPKQEWSMYDETILKALIDHFEYKKEFNEAEDYDIVLWLKSLRHQSQWKPSEEQMKALEWQVNNTSEGSWQYEESKNLLEQLKKLKG